jgi:hypothetical protein
MNSQQKKTTGGILKKGAVFFKSREKIEKPFRKRKKQGSRGIVQGKIAFLK